jgi:hypothetical protein
VQMEVNRESNAADHNKDLPSQGLRTIMKIRLKWGMTFLSSYCTLYLNKTDF